MQSVLLWHASLVRPTHAGLPLSAAGGNANWCAQSQSLQPVKVIERMAQLASGLQKSITCMPRGMLCMIDACRFPYQCHLALLSSFRFQRRCDQAQYAVNKASHDTLQPISCLLQIRLRICLIIWKHKHLSSAVYWSKCEPVQLCSVRAYRASNAISFLSTQSCHSFCLQPHMHILTRS